MNKLKEIVIDNFADAAVVNNYRISSDGMLTKRDGFRTLTSLGEHIRGYCYDGADTMYTVAGSKLYRIVGDGALSIGELSEAEFESDEERCLVYFYAGVIYIVGGGAFYCFDTTDPLAELKTFEHIPVCISDHSDYNVESYNLISERALAVTKASASLRTLTLSDKDTIITSVKLDGTELAATDYSISVQNGICYVKLADSVTISGSHLLAVEYVVKSEDFENKKELCSKCSSAYVYEGKSGVRVFLYGGEEGCIYYSNATDLPVDAQTGETTAMTPGTLIGDYYSEGNEIFAPGEGEKIRAILPFGERLLVITDRATYYLVEDTKTVDGVLTLKGFRLVSMDKDLGIGERSGVVSYDGKIYLIGSLGLYSMSYNSIEDKYSTHRLNIPENVGISRGDMDSVCLHVDRVNHELWLQNGDTCAVYSFASKKWYRFSGFCPTSFFTYQNASAFTEADKICVFTVGEMLDGGEGFEAYVETYNLDLGNIFAEKTIYSFGATVERCEGAALMCTLKSDKGATFTFRVDADGNGTDTTPVVKRTHARLGGCYYVICRVGSPADAAPANLRSILISYRVMGGNE